MPKKKALGCKRSKELDLSEITCYDVNTIPGYSKVPTQFNPHSDPKEVSALKDIKQFLKGVVGQSKEVFTLDTKSAEKLDEDETYYVEKIRLPWSEDLSRLCYLSKNLFNHVMWLIKMRYDFTCQPENLSWLEQLKQRIEKKHKNAIFSSFPALLHDFKKAQESLVQKINTPSGRQGYYGHRDTLIEDFGQTKKYRYFANPDPTIYFQIGVYMYYPELWQLVRHGQHYKALGGQTAQQTLKKVTRAWASYSKLKAEWNKN